MIQIENISKVFRTSEVETVALNHVNLDIKEGRSGRIKRKRAYPRTQG